jgi:hypothetical protein
MSQKIIEWDRDRLVMAEAISTGAKATFHKVQVAARESDSADTLALVDPLRTLFQSVGEKKRPSVTVVFPRQLVTIHRIQLPLVADSEIPDMIRLQAAMKLTVPVDSVCMDFTPLPIQPGSATRDVLLVTVPNDQIAIVRRTLNDANLELSAVKVSAYCVAQVAAAAGIVSAASEAGTVEVIAVMRRDFIELTFLRGTAVVFSHSGSSWSSPDSIERTIRAEMTRARMSAAETLGEHKIGRVVLVGSPEITAAVSDQISARLDGARIERIDPAVAFMNGELPSGIAAADLVTLAGAVIEAQSVAVESVDLINPRRAPEKKDMRRIWALLAALAGILMFAGVHFWRKGKLDELNATLTRLNTENTTLSATVDAGDEEMDRATRVGEWVKRDIEWLDEMNRLRSILPGTDRMFIDNLTFNATQPPANVAVQRSEVGSVRLEGYAKSEQDINELARRLRDAGYGLKPFKIVFRASAAQEYGASVILEITLPEPAAS